MKWFPMAALFAVALSITGCGEAQAQTKIGYINFQELLAMMPEAKTLQTQLEAYGNELQTTYDQYIQELQTRQKDYQANAGTWSEVKREAAEADIQSLVARIEDFQTTSQEKLVNKQNELMAPVIEKAEKAVKDVGTEQGLTYIMDAGTLLHMGPGSIDVLPLVKAKLNL
jgi:outer membrane protein